MTACGEDCPVDSEIMSWDEYLRRIDWVTDLLRPAVEEGHYVPDAIFGISNGGLIVADLLGKSVFSGKSTPILSLWARRYTKDRDYFKNFHNEAILKAIKESLPKDRKPEVLLFDDHFGSGATSFQAIDYLMEILGDKTKIMYIPLASKTKENFVKVEDHFPYNYKHKNQKLFPITKAEFEQKLYTNAKYFPYLNKQLKDGLEQLVT